MIDRQVSYFELNEFIGLLFLLNEQASLAIYFVLRILTLPG